FYEIRTFLTDRMIKKLSTYNFFLFIVDLEDNIYVHNVMN
ncbi:hypothetical protein LCGC14_2517940, partial [marine sediment metagenome]